VAVGISPREKLKFHVLAAVRAPTKLGLFCLITKGCYFGSRAKTAFVSDEIVKIYRTYKRTAQKKSK
jgi:hypothetical protein